MSVALNVLAVAVGLGVGYALTWGRWSRKLRRAADRDQDRPVPVTIRTLEGSTGSRGWRSATLWVDDPDWRVEPRFDGPPFDLVEPRVVGSRRWTRRDWWRYSRGATVLVCDFLGGRCEVLVCRRFVSHLVGDESPPSYIKLSTGKPG
jgi:hypothetical protein